MGSKTYLTAYAGVVLGKTIAQCLLRNTKKGHNGISNCLGEHKEHTLKAEAEEFQPLLHPDERLQTENLAQF